MLKLQASRTELMTSQRRTLARDQRLENSRAFQLTLIELWTVVTFRGPHLLVHHYSSIVKPPMELGTTEVDGEVHTAHGKPTQILHEIIDISMRDVRNAADFFTITDHSDDHNKITAAMVLCSADNAENSLPQIGDAFWPGDLLFR
jgi:hypothetical protein